MESLQEEYEKMSTEQLEQLLRDDFDEIAPLSVDMIFLICDILAKRRPSKQTTEECWESFVKNYLPLLEEQEEVEEIL